MCQNIIFFTITMQEPLVTHMVNLSKVATNHKITPQQAITHFDSAVSTSIKNLSSGVKITESNIDQNVLASINARKNRERIHGFLNSDGSQKYKG